MSVVASIMNGYVITERSFLQKLHDKRKNPRGLQATIRDASNNQIRAIYEVVGNSVKNPKLVRLHLGNLRDIKKNRQHKYFKEFLNKQTPLVRRKRLLNQHGNGILGTALSFIPKILAKAAVKAAPRVMARVVPRVAARVVPRLIAKAGPRLLAKAGPRLLARGAKAAPGLFKRLAPKLGKMAFKKIKKAPKMLGKKAVRKTIGKAFSAYGKAKDYTSGSGGPSTSSPAQPTTTTPNP